MDRTKASDAFNAGSIPVECIFYFTEFTDGWNPKPADGPGGNGAYGWRRKQQTKKTQKTEAGKNALPAAGLCGQ